MSFEIVSDLHTHTNYSHGHGTPEENVRAAIAVGLKRIAISEHAPAHMFFGVRGEKLVRLRREIDTLSKRYAGDIEVLMGLECNLTAYGECDAPLPSSPERGMFDLTLLGYHKGVFPRDGFMLSRGGEAMLSLRSDPVRTANALLAAAEKYKIDILSHPCEYVRADIDTLAAGSKKLGVLLEINSSHVSLTPDELRRARALGARFIIGSDAHVPSRVGDFVKAIAAAEQAGLSPSDIVNAAPDAG